MDADGFLAALAPALTDPDARAAFLADPRTVLAAAGLEIPEWVRVTAHEGDAPELSIVLPPLTDPGSELSEEELRSVGGGSCFTWTPPTLSGQCQTPP